MPASWSGAKLLKCMARPRPRHDIVHRRHREHPRQQRDLRRFPRPSSLSAPWRSRWRANSGPKNIHVVHLVIDAGVDSEAIHAADEGGPGG